MRALAVLLVIAACKREPTQTVEQEPHVRHDAAIDSRGFDTDLLARLDALEPGDTPPPPLVRKHRRGDCRAEYAPRPNRDPNPMCRVQGGTFLMGDGSGSPTGKPVSTTLGDFDIDQFEVTYAQAVRFLNVHGNACPGIDLMNHPSQTTPCVWLLKGSGIRENDGRYSVTDARAMHAATFTWEGAMRYCAWAGKQVPTSAQWEYAGRHDPESGRDLIYPWGDEWRARRVACLADGCTPTPTGIVGGMPVGSFDGTRGRGDGSSPWGVHDMAGSEPELVFECDDPETTCTPGGHPCPCKKLETSNDGAGSPKDLRLTYRVDRTDLKRGGSGVRCVRSRHR